MHPDSPQKQIRDSKTETPQQWVLYLLFLYIVISRAYLKFSIFPLIKTHTHTPCISIQAMKPPKTRHPGISPLGWSSTKDMTRTTPSRPASHPVCLWQYSFQHAAQRFPLSKRKTTYIFQKRLWVQALSNRLKFKADWASFLGSEKGTWERVPSAPLVMEVLALRAACSVSSPFPLTL